MELVWNFRYLPNQTFDFLGDDDVWVFVGPEGKPAESRLVMDLGGIHEQEPGNFRLDDIVNRGILNLSPNDRVTMRLFYVERHSTAANIRIMSNIITTVPSKLFLDVGSEPLIAGEPKIATGMIFDNDGTRMTDFSNGTFTWTAREATPGNGTANNPINSVNSTNNTKPNTGDIKIWSKRNNVATNKSDSIYLSANKAYTTVMITGRYCVGNTCISDSVLVNVLPGPASKLTIEASADSLARLRNSAPLRYIEMTSGQASTEAFYAILRDDYGNWVRAAAHGVGGSSNTWTAARTTVATATNGTNQARGQGKAERVSIVGDTTPVSVTHRTSGGATFTGNSVIRLLDINYVGIRVGVKIGGTTFYQIPGDSIFIALPGDSTIFVEMQRSDNNLWVEAPAAWSAVAREGTAPSGIPNGPSYTYSPSAPGYILLIARVPNGTAADTMRIRSDYRTPASLRFFNTDAAPVSLSDTLTKYPTGDTKQYLYPVPTAPVNVVTVAAGVTMPIVTAAFGSNPPAINSYIPPNSLNGKYVWSIVNNTDANATKITPSALGYTADFRSTLAHQTHVVRAAYVVGNDTIVDQTLWVRVIPGDIAAVYIEPESQDLTRSSMNKPLTFNGSAPVLGDDGVILSVNDLLVLTKVETSRQVYALLRDKWGNYIAPSGGYNLYGPPSITYKPTTWASGNLDVVQVATGNAETGQGIVTKDTTARGNTAITARDETFPTAAQGRLPVEIRAYSYTDLRIVDKDKKPIDKLETTTNDEPEIRVQGKRSDCGEPGGPTGEACWEDVTGNWDRDEGLVNSLQPPTPGSSWKLDPRKPGDGNIIVSTPGLVPDGEGNLVPGTIYAELPTVIKLGPPNRAELVIITPPDQIKAGQPIQAEVRYFNRTGLMESWDPSWNSASDRAEFKDNQGLGNATSWKPSVTSESGKKDLGYNNTLTSPNARLAPDPATGRDTVTFILYNAMDNPHRLSYDETIAGLKLPTSFASVTLLPGDPVKVVIVDGDGDDVGNKVEIEHGDNIILITVGEDEYGNRTGQENSRWCVPKDAAIPQSNAKCEGEYPVIVYETEEAEKNGCGKLTATPSNSALRGDEVELCIINVSLKPSYAITRDDGDGYLDAIDVVFAANFQTTTVNFDASKINLHYNGKQLPCKSATVKDNVVTLVLNEASSGELQTGWEPTLTIESGLIENVRFSGLVVRDGAAPVVYTAKLHFDPSGDKTRNFIEVRFSEKVRSIKGEFNEQVASSYKPNELFKIWTLDNGMSKVRDKKLSKTAKTSAADTRRFDLVRDALDGISKVTYVDDMTLKFALENGRELGPPSYYINISADDNLAPSVRSEIRDNLTPPNVPDEKNRKVAITLANEPNEKMIPVPNPASPDKQKVGNSDQAKTPDGKVAGGGNAYKYIGAYHNPGAVPHIKAGGGGAVFQVPIYIPRDPDNPSSVGKIKCQVKVYDLAGNLVSSGAEEDMLSVNRDPAADGATYSQMHLFWSGYNSKGMKAAPGTYRIVVQISYPNSKDPKAKNVKHTGSVGIAK
jgi:fibro-slime domain-containing protein